MATLARRRLEDYVDAMEEVPPNAAPGKALSPAARRALEEAEARRLAAAEAEAAPEEGGPKGLEPTRFGDWERKGLAIDF
jgi:hypothetical protein